MVKTITKYKCEICNDERISYEEAFNCEQYGYEEPLAKIGDVVDYFEAGIEGWDSVDTDLPDLIITDIKRSEYNPHYLEYILSWRHENGELIVDHHANVGSNQEFIHKCTLKSELRGN